MWVLLPVRRRRAPATRYLRDTKRLLVLHLTLASFLTAVSRVIVSLEVSGQTGQEIPGIIYRRDGRLVLESAIESSNEAILHRTCWQHLFRGSSAKIQ